MKRIIILAILLSGCSTSVKDMSYSGAALTGGATGAAVGAGAGAIAGSLISNGSVGASAALGAGVGLGVRIAGAIAYKNYQEYDEISDNNQVLQKNYDEIMLRNIGLEHYRAKVEQDIYLAPPTTNTNQEYLGRVND